MFPIRKRMKCLKCGKQLTVIKHTSKYMNFHHSLKYVSKEKISVKIWGKYNISCRECFNTTR